MSLSKTATEQKHLDEDNLQFITYSSESAPRLGRELRGAVRAHVTRRQHRQKQKTDPFRTITVSRLVTVAIVHHLRDTQSAWLLPFFLRHLG